MTTAYTDVFGNSTLPPSEYGYNAFSLTVNATFVWPYNASSSEAAVAKIMDITCSAGISLTLPDATEVSTGEDFLIRNVGAEALLVKDAGGNVVQTVDAGKAVYFYVTDNTTAAGTYGVVAYGVGSSAVDAASLIGYGIKAIGSSLNQSHPVILSSGPITIDDSYRAKLVVNNGGNYTIDLADASVLGDDFFFLFRNNGTGTTTIDANGSQTIDSQASVTIQPGESLLLFCSGAQWYSVGYGRSTLYQFTQLVKDVSAGGTFTLTSQEASNKLISFIGNPAVAVTVIVPSIVSVYYLDSQLSTSQGVTVKTAAGTGVGVAQGARIIALCDGTNVLSAQSVISTTSITLIDGTSLVPALSFASQTNTGLYKAGADGLGITVDGTPTMTMTTAGGINIPIGGANQVQYLDGSKKLSGSASLTFNSNTNTLNAPNISTNGTVTLGAGTANGILYLNGSKQVTATSSLSFDGDGAVISVNSTSAGLRITQQGTGDALLVQDVTGDTTPFVINASGNVGIGVSSPAFNLHIGGDTGNPAATIDYFQENSAGSALLFRKARGTPTVPTSVAINDYLGAMMVRGFGMTTMGTVNVGLAGFRASESFTDSSQGTYFVVETTADGGTTRTERLRINASGNVGIGSSVSQNDSAFTVNKQVVAGTTAYGIRNFSTIDSSTTTTYNSIVSSAGTAAAAFTLTNLFHVRASQGSIGAGSSITNQAGFTADSSLTSATNNYGFRSELASGSGCWNFYAAGTADNYFAGNVGIGAAPTYDLDVTGTVRVTVNQAIGALPSTGTQLRIGQSADQTLGTEQAILFSGVGYSGGIALDTTSMQIGHNSTSRALTFHTGTAYAERMRIDGGGRVSFSGGNQTDTWMWMSGTVPSSATGAYGYRASLTFPSTTTGTASVFLSSATTEAASFTVASFQHFSAVQGTLGAGSSITTQYGFVAGSTLTGATNNYGFWSNIASGTGRWNFYAAGTADNYFAGNILQGSTTSYGIGGSALNMQNHATSVNGISLTRWGGGTATQASYLIFGKSRGGAVGTYGAVVSGDDLGNIWFAGDDGTDINQRAVDIIVQVDGTVANNSVPGRIVFKTTPVSGTAPVERMRITNGGAIIAAQGAPASFAAAGTLTAANALTRIITASGTTYSLTLDTGTNWEAGVASWTADTAVDFSIISTASGTVTVATATGWTLVGTMTVAAGASAQFRARKTATNTFTLYRIG